LEEPHVHRRFPRTIASALLIPALGIVASIAHAAPKDAAAQALDKQAMDTDYLNVDFAGAEGKLRKALNECGASGCAPAVKAQLYMHLGIILANAQKSADATSAFAEGLKIDPNATPEKDFTSDVVQKAYDAAKSQAGTPTPAGTGDKPPPSTGPEANNDLKHDPITEAPVKVPIPIYVNASGDATKYILFYKPFGGDFVKLEMKKKGKSFRAEIPCKDVLATGVIKYYIQAQDAQGDVVGTAGSKKTPLEISVKNKISGEPPSFPGEEPPNKCKDTGDCPPGLNEEGCEKPKLGYGSKCIGPGQCSTKDGLACVEGTCQPGKEEGSDEPTDPESGPVKMNMLSITATIDSALLSGSDLCTLDNYSKGTYTCFRQDQDNRLYRPTDTQAQKGNFAGPPFALGTIRVLLGYDRVIVKDQPFTLGVRVGYAFNGGPGVPEGFNKDGTATSEKKFMPFHLEARATYYLGKGVLSRAGVRPFVYASGGLAQVDSKVSGVPVDNDCKGFGLSSDKNASPYACKVDANGKLQELKNVNVDVWRKMGTGFIAVGGGMGYAINKASMFTVDLKFSLFLGSAGFAISPSIGFVQQL
jgi:hypothetical protein